MIEVDYNDYKSVVESNMKLIPKNYELTKKVEELQDRIDKAIELLKEAFEIKSGITYMPVSIKKVVDVLEGWDKE